MIGWIASARGRADAISVAVQRRGARGYGVLAVAVCLLVAGCDAFEDAEYRYPDPSSRRGLPTYERPESIFGAGGLSFGGSSDASAAAEAAPGIGVNSYLWRASLDTVAFMPLLSADPFGGVIITDWYAPPESPNERFKINIYILDRELRADGLRTSVFRQVFQPGAGWVDAQTASSTASDLENAILTRARQMRIAQIGG